MCLVSVKRAKVRAPHFPALIDEFVPGKAAVIDDIVMGFEDAVGERFCHGLMSFAINFT
jgi:hypothetical protein